MIHPVLRALRGFVAFWIDFIVGDDWRIAAGAVLGLAATGWLSHHGLSAWWVMPVCAPALLGFSLWRAAATAARRH